VTGGDAFSDFCIAQLEEHRPSVYAGSKEFGHLVIWPFGHFVADPNE
jgi:hypothetical protein